MTAPLPATVVLAAGRAVRMGGGKLSRPVAGRPVIAHLLDRLADGPFREGVVVHRPDDPEVRALAEAAGMTPVALASPGLGASLAAGVRAAEGAAGWLVVLGDQPLVDPDQLDLLVDAWRRGTKAVFSDGGAGPQPPAVFDAALGGALRALRGDSGARRLARLPGATTMAFPPGPWMLDVDVEEDLRRLEGLVGGAG